MLDLATLKKSYPANLQVFDRFIVKEYLQYKILEAIFALDYGKKLCFLGGTALRIIHGNARFSEDLDFDNFGLTEASFADFIAEIKGRLELEGYQVETRNVFKGAYRCYLKFPGLLNRLGLSGQEEEKVLIQIDTIKQDYSYEFSEFLLNKFDVFTKINTAPADILLAKKIGAAIGRKTLKGRDFFDVVFLFSLTSPNYDYLRVKDGIHNLAELKTRLLAVLDGVDLNDLAKDVGPFLFNPNELTRVTLFRDFVNQLR